MDTSQIHYSAFAALQAHLIALAHTARLCRFYQREFIRTGKPDLLKDARTLEKQLDLLLTLTRPLEQALDSHISEYAGRILKLV